MSVFLIFRNDKSQGYEIRNLSRYKQEYSKLLVEIGTPEVDIYMKDYLFFVIFPKKTLTIFFYNES